MFISKVEDTFQISGRGCVVALSMPRSGCDFRLRTRDSIRLLQPDGTILDTHIAGVEILCGPKVLDRMGLLLPQNITKQEVPIGTEVWLIRQG